MSREKQIERLRDMIHDELENLRCDAKGGCLPDNAWDRVDALTAGFLRLKIRRWPKRWPSAERQGRGSAELLRTPVQGCHVPPKSVGCWHHGSVAGRLGCRGGNRRSADGGAIGAKTGMGQAVPGQGSVFDG